MKTFTITACCVLFLARWSLAANPTWTLHPGKDDQLKASGIQVSYQVIVNDVENPEYAFTITAKVPPGVDGLDAMLSIRNSQGVVALNSWSDTEGKCVADFTVGKQSLKDAGFGVQLYRGKRTDAFSASGRYVLSLAEFASDPHYCSGRAGVEGAPQTAEFRIGARIQRDGPWLTVEVTPQEALSNHHYDLHVVVESRSDEHYQIRNGQPITKREVRLADLNADGFLDIMIVGGVDHQGQDWYKTLIYDEGTNRYRWLAQEANAPDKSLDKGKD